MNISNIKDTITSWAGLLLVVSGAVLAVATGGVALPSWLSVGATVVATVCGSLIAWATGKNPNLTTKTDQQLDSQNTGK